MGSAQAGERTRKPLGWKRIVGYVISAAIVGAIFVWAIPKFADYSDVMDALGTLTPIEFWSLFAATVFNLITYWWANQAALPGLGIGKAAVLTQTTTSVANTIPAGGAVAVGLTYSMLNSWGFSGTNVALYVGVTGIWNIFTKLALPLIALVLLALTGHLTVGYVTAAVVGVIVLGVAVTLLDAGVPERAIGHPRRRRSRSGRVVVPAPLSALAGDGLGRGRRPVPSGHDLARAVPLVPADLDHGAEPGRAVLRAPAVAPAHGRLRVGDLARRRRSPSTRSRGCCRPCRSRRAASGSSTSATSAACPRSTAPRRRRSWRRCCSSARSRTGSRSRSAGSRTSSGA